MIRYRLRLLGIPILSFEIDGDELVYEEDGPAAEIGSGSAHNFERDGTPLDPTDKYREEWDGFGFGGST
jgi:hypothetical protein